MQSDRPYRYSLVDQIAEKLRQRILSGNLKPGDFLPAQKDLATEFNVGLSTIHQATQRLTALGLVESKAGKGTWVRPDATAIFMRADTIRTRLSDLNARELYEARSITEVALTRLAAQRATPQDLHDIRDTLVAMAAACDEDTFVEADLAFHVAVARAGHNRLLEQFYHVARQLLSEVIAELVKLPDVKENSILIQTAIADALEARDTERAYQAATSHMHYIEELLDQYE
jgi:GntR family transcriptional regulator, transcriptional repressor for pyruvate dehydrogenase complex